MRKQRSSGSLKPRERKGNEWKNMDEEKLGDLTGQTVVKEFWNDRVTLKEWKRVIGREYQWQRLIDSEFEEMKAKDYNLREKMENSNCVKCKVTRSQNVKDLNFTGVEWQEYLFLKGRKCDIQGHQNRLQISADISLLQLEFPFASPS